MVCCHLVTPALPEPGVCEERGQPGSGLLFYLVVLGFYFSFFPLIILYLASSQRKSLKSQGFGGLALPVIEPGGFYRSGSRQDPVFPFFLGDLEEQRVIFKLFCSRIKISLGAELARAAQG